MQGSIDNFSFDSVGLVRDTPASDLPPEAFSFGQNVHMDAGRIQNAQGHEAFFTPQVAPYWLLPTQTATNAWWIYAGLNKVRVTDGTTDADITRVSGDYTATADTRWCGGVLGTIPILNNGVDPPQQWDRNPANPLVDLQNWPVGEVAAVVRPFLSFLVRLDITRGGVRYPQLVGWSSAADPGTVPNSWDPADPTTLAGERPLSQTDGPVVDMLPISQNVNIIYKSDSIHAMRFVEGSQEVFDFWEIGGETGILAKNCVAYIPQLNAHFVFATNDIVLCDGQSVASILFDRYKEEVFESIDPVNGFRSFVALDTKEQKAWACFPEQGHEFPNKALVFDWRTKALGMRDLPSCAHISHGVLNPPGISERRWDDEPSVAWKDAHFRWNERRFNPMTKRIVQASPLVPDVTQINGATFNGVAPECILEREDFVYLPNDKGGFSKNTTLSKQWGEAWLDIEGTGQVEVYAGGRNVPNGPITYAPPEIFTIGEDSKVSLWEAGSWRYPAYRLRIVSGGPWKLKALSFDMTPAGVDY